MATIVLDSLIRSRNTRNNYLFGKEVERHGFFL